MAVIPNPSRTAAASKIGRISPGMFVLYRRRRGAAILRRRTPSRDDRQGSNLHGLRLADDPVLAIAVDSALPTELTQLGSQLLRVHKVLDDAELTAIA